MLICKPFSPAVTGVCNRNKGAEKVWKGHLELQSSSRWGEIHLLLELLKCIHTTSENNSEAFFLINCKWFCFYHPSADFQHQLPQKRKLQTANYTMNSYTTWSVSPATQCANIPNNKPQNCSMLPCTCTLAHTRFFGDTVTSHDIAEMEKTACKHQSLCEWAFVMTKGWMTN